ncbi:Dyp-type peroxidase [Jiangella gansuensis]|uniref:Dyp-type peroxidase n=1 Tax=Jiangella gansuensis TaxID=281473 RepID=UPI000687C496|nr:Dyp-type peroxidase [Jiangella gansuensis]
MDGPGEQPQAEQDPEVPDIRRPRRVTRRALFGTAAGVAAVAGAAGVGGYAVGNATADDAPPAEPSPTVGRVTPDGFHQPGISTAQQQYACIAAFDVMAPLRDNLIELMRRWTPLATALMRGEPGPERPNRDVADSGVADDLGPANLTMTFGFGPRVFGEEFGLGVTAPTRLAELPAFEGDQLDPRWVGGDVLVQICADDPTVVAHAIREARARVPGIANARWTHYGFLTDPGDGRTPRNLFGQLDGTANPRPGSSDFDEIVWAGADEPDGMRGGSYLVLRKIRMLMPMWDTSTAAEQNAALGRDRHTGAPLSGGTEHTPLDLTRTGDDGRPLIAMDAHVRLAHGAVPMLRRSYNYDNGLALPASAGVPDEGHTHPPGTAPHEHGPARPGMGHWDSGMLFMTYVRDPSTQYVPLQVALSRADRLHSFLQHTGSAVFAIPGAAHDGEFVGQRLLTAAT